MPPEQAAVSGIYNDHISSFPPLQSSGVAHTVGTWGAYGSSLLDPPQSTSSEQGIKQKKFRYVGCPPLPCPFCPRIFKNKRFFNEHVEKKHKEQSFKCSTCDKSFKTQITMKKHIHALHPDTISGAVVLQYECYMCHEQCKSLPVLRRHIYKHTRSRRHLCTLCGYMTASTYHFDMHMMRNDHNLTGETVKPHRCDICGQAFSSKHTLAIHVTTHSDQRDCPCSICGKAFKNKKNLGQHMLTHGEKRHKCQMCPYRCYSPGNLKIHMKVHTGR